MCENTTKMPLPVFTYGVESTEYAAHTSPIPPGRPHSTWMKTIQQDLKSNNLSLNNTIDVAQNRPLWRLMSTFGGTHS